MRGIRAKFVGRDSLGYVHGQTYLLQSKVSDGWIWIKPLHPGPRPCPYDSLEAFLVNWQIEGGADDK